MANEIKIIIGGDPAGLVRASHQSADALDQLGNAADSAAQSFAQLGPSAQRATQNVERFKAGLRGDPTTANSLLNVSNDFKKVEANSRSAASAVRSFSSATSAGNGAILDFSRVIQDLPFGLLGIVNNLTQIPGTLQRLSIAAKESGKSMGSLLLSSIGGFGGIGLVLSAVTSGLLIFQNGIMGFGRASKQAKEEADELAKTIRAIGDIEAEAVGGVQGQIAQVNSLAAAIADSNLPYDQRKRALEELREINKSYFGDLKLEDEATGKLTKTVSEYTKALVATAIVKSFVNEIAEVAKAVIKADDDIVKARTRLAAASKEVEDAQKRTSKGATEEQISGLANEATAALKKQTTAQEELRAAHDKSTQLQEQQLLLQDRLNKAQLEAIKFKDLDTGKSEKEVDLLTKRLHALEKIRDATKDLSAIANLQEQIFDLQVKITLRDAAKNGLSKEEVDLAIKGFKDQLTEAFNKEALSFEAIPKVKVTRVELAPIPTGAVESAIAKATGLDKQIKLKSDRDIKIELQGLEFVLAQEEAKKAVERLRETILNGAIDSVANTASAFGEAIAGAFSGKGIGESFAKAAEGILSGIGGVLQEIGKQIIATSTLIKALKESLKTLFANPVGGILVGVGLIALGGLLKNIKIPGFAGGVNNFSGGLAWVGEDGPELVRLPRGSDVIPNHMLGSAGVNVTLAPVLEFGYDRLYIGLQRTQERRRRLG